MNTWNNYDDDMDTKKSTGGMGSGAMNTPGQSGSPEEMPETTGNPSHKSDEKMKR